MAAAALSPDLDIIFQVSMVTEPIPLPYTTSVKTRSPITAIELGVALSKYFSNSSAPSGF